MKKLFLLWAVLLTGLSISSFTLAHPAPGSTAFIDFTVDGARIEQDVPIEELERALHQMLLEEGESPEQMLLRRGSFLRTYAQEHLGIRGISPNTSWAMEVTDLTGYVANDGPRVVFHYRAVAPSGQTSSSVRIHDDLVVHEVVSHYTQMYVRSDWSTGVENATPQIAGVIHAGRFDIDVSRHGTFGRGLRAVVRLGIEHIASGTDHVLFVLVLLLTAPVVAFRGRWRADRNERATLLALAAVVSAFTIGHSLTLILAALGWVRLSPAIVEPAIAFSIFITAVHAWRPLFPRREVLVAGAFGLVHGLAFASNLPRQDLGSVQTAWTLFGFNVGIEVGQLAVLALVVPWILLLARTRAFSAFRVVAAGFTGILAMGWFIERIANVPNPMARLVAWLEAHPLPLLIVLAIGAVVARAISLRQPPVLSASAIVTRD